MLPGLVLLCLAFSARADSINNIVPIDLKPQPLSRALTKLAEQSGLQIVFAEQSLQGFTSPALQGYFSPASVLEILLRDSNLVFSVEGATTIVVKEKPERLVQPMRRSGSSGGGRIEEIIVTAQKREEKLQDVPIVVVVIAGKKIEDMGIGRLDDLTAYMPGVSNTEASSGSFLYIRGIGSAGNKGFEQSVGTYIDGIYYGRDRSSRNGLFDLERVEILKGPQGILFGKNTIAGAINMTTRGPGMEPEGYVKLGYGFETEEKVIEAAYGGMLTDTFGARFAVRHAEMDGWLKNSFNGQNIGEEDDLVARLSALWEPTPALEMIGKLTWSRLRQNEKTAQLTHCSQALQGFVAGVDDCRLDDKTTVTAYNRFDGGFGFEKLEALSAGWTVNWDLDGHVLTSVSGYTEHTDDMYLDSDYTHQEVLEAVRDEEFEAYSQEFRIASATGGTLDYIAGVYIEDSEMEWTANLGLDLNPRGVPARAGRAKLTRQETTSRAIFGQLTWHVSDAFSATLGGRYSKDEKDGIANNFCAVYKTFIPTGQPACALGPGFVLEGSRSDENVSPALILEWRPANDHMLYAKYSQGYKSGGFDLATNSPAIAPFFFEPEEVDSLEVGSKSTLLDGSMTLNVAIFRNQYTDLQVSTFDGNVGHWVGNAAEAISQGGDLDINWALTDHLRISLAISYLDAKHHKFPQAQCSFPQIAMTPAGQTCVNDLSGKDLQYAPDVAAHWSLTWEKSLTDNYLLVIATDLVYSDSFYTANDLDPHFRQDSYYKIDARISLQSLNSGWELALVGRNLNDDETSHYGDDVPLSPGSYFKHLDKPRTLALQASWRF